MSLSRSSSLASATFKRLFLISLVGPSGDRLPRLTFRFLILGLSLIAATAGVVSPYFQKIFVDRLLQHSGGSISGYVDQLSPAVLIFVAFLATLIGQGLNLLASYLGAREGMILQENLAHELYEKTLATRTDEMAGTTIGEIVSIYATDVSGSSAFVDQVIPMAASIVFPMVLAPLAIHRICGIPILLTVSVMIVMIALNVVLASRQSRFFYRFKFLAAERTGIVNEWIQNIRLLRILGWVENFEAKIFAKRIEETSNRVSMVTNGQLMNSFGSCITYVLNLTGIGALLYIHGQTVTPGDLFALLWILGVFLTRPFRQTPWIFTFLLDSISSLRRVAGYLEKPASAGGSTPEARTEKVDAQPIEVRGLRVAFDGSEKLTDLSFTIEAGEFVAVVGEVGSGKSLLVQALLGETNAAFDEYRIGETEITHLDLGRRREYFSFVPQDGFVMSATLRENIAFRYGVSERDDQIRHSLKRAQFDLAIESVRDGLNTEIGERGVNLSGGQRQRVSLARADYFDRPIVLLDDCLSAVDVDTEARLVNELLLGAWSGKTRILVTHRLSVLEKVDRVFFLEKGRLIECGPFEDLLARSGAVRNFVASLRRGESFEKTEGADANVVEHV